MNFVLILAILALAFVSCDAGQAHGGFLAYDPTADATQHAIDVIFPENFCWRDTYGRGVGRIPRRCAQGEDQFDLTCYKNCQSFGTDEGIRYERWKTSCRQRCPLGFQQDSSDEMMCVKPNGNLKLQCTDHGFACKAGNKCKKNVIERTPYLGSMCPPGEEMDVGLCYPKCRDGYTGRGPVCWSQPPEINGERWVNCGMGAAKSTTDCGFVITDQIISPILLALNVVTFGATGAIGQALRTAKLTARVGNIAFKLGAAAFSAAELARKKKRMTLRDHINHEKANN